MGRLIDADKLLEETRRDRDYAEKNGFMDMYYERQALIERINAQPTVYDPSKVVRQLKEIEKIMTSPVNEDCFGEECRASDCMVCLISKVIEIVKGGGVDAKTDS